MGAIFGIVTLMLASLFGLRAAEVKTNSSSAVVAANQLDDITKIGIGDLVSFRIIEDRDQPRTLSVTDSGELDVPYVGRVKAVNKTCKQLSGELKGLLEKDYYHVATPMVAIDRVGARNLEQVLVTGAVGRPGYVDIAPGDKVPISKVIQSAGGLSGMAKRVVKVTRTKDGVTQVINVDMREIMERAKVDQDIRIFPGDRIFVEARIFNPL